MKESNRFALNQITQYNFKPENIKAAPAKVGDTVSQIVQNKSRGSNV